MIKEMRFDELLEGEIFYPKGLSHRSLQKCSGGMVIDEHINMVGVFKPDVVCCVKNKRRIVYEKQR